MFGGVQVISQIRSNQKVRLHKREQNVHDYFAAHPGTPHTIRIRGGQEMVAIVAVHGYTSVPTIPNGSSWR